MANYNETAPIQASHLRIHKSLTLHGFDDNGKVIAEYPLLDQWKQIRLSASGKVEFLVEEAAQPLKNHLHFSLVLPFPDSQYYDAEDGTRIIPTDHWKFHFGFRSVNTTIRQYDLAGIGTVDIADISILPHLATLRTAPGCNPLGWIFPKPTPVPPTPLPIVPDTYPDSQLLAFAILPHFLISPDQPIQIGIFVGQSDADAPLTPFLMVGFDRSQLSLTANPV